VRPSNSTVCGLRRRRKVVGAAHLLRTPTPAPTPDTMGAASILSTGGSQTAAAAQGGFFQRRGGLPRRRMRRCRSRREPPRTQASASAASDASRANTLCPECSRLMASRHHQCPLHASVSQHLGLGAHRPCRYPPHVALWPHLLELAQCQERPSIPMCCRLRSRERRGPGPAVVALERLNKAQLEHVHSRL
jgi:hypothetical protein